MASFLVEEPRNWVTIAPYVESLPFNVGDMTVGDEQPWLRPSPGLWRMRRVEVAVLSVVLAAFFGLVFWAAGGPLPGLISAAVMLLLGALFTWFQHRRFRAWR